MKSLLISGLFFLFLLTGTAAQTGILPDSNYIIGFNQQVDNFVVKQDMKALDTIYANDFVFSHGTGKVEGKAGWLTTVGSARYPMRQHDSVSVERHPGIAVVKGRMSIQRIDKDGTANYQLRYVRIYALRQKRWQMITHLTTWEYHPQ